MRDKGRYVELGANSTSALLRAFLSHSERKALPPRWAPPHSQVIPYFSETRRYIYFVFFFGFLYAFAT